MGWVSLTCIEDFRPKLQAPGLCLKQELALLYVHLSSSTSAPFSYQSYLLYYIFFFAFMCSRCVNKWALCKKNFIMHLLKM